MNAIADKCRFQLRHGGQEVDVSAGADLIVGRDPECGIVLRDGLVSRRHGRFSHRGDALSVADLGSMNGVFVNERRIHVPTTLAHGDVVTIGVESFEVLDNAVVPRSKRATIPQPLGTSPLPPYAKSDVDDDGPEQVTRTATLQILTDRERQVFELLVLGYTQGEMAAKLHVSVKTVETHRAHIAEKLNCRTRAELVAYALACGVLRLGELHTQGKA